MKREKKGLSTVVTTLIIVLLVLAAIGIIWSPIRQLLTQSSSSLDQTKCLDLEIRATRVILDPSDVTNQTYNVTLRRGSTGNFDAGAKLIFYTDTANSQTESFSQLLSSLDVRTASVSTNLANANKVEVIPYFIDENSGQDVTCPTSTTFEFRL
ncbi:MAG: hypothetical protein KKB62_03015 [Nanoarchaeota archaeon]|nr:hypothetical protein [Nanoarchaeota archaeon]